MVKKKREELKFLFSFLHIFLVLALPITTAYIRVRTPSDHYTAQAVQHGKSQECVPPSNAKFSTWLVHVYVGYIM